jgi:predicted RNA-binding protein with PIN domain
MIIIIDAYNFIKSISAHKFVNDRVIADWITTFQNYMILRGNKIILVFDAGPFFNQTREVHGGVEIIYAGHSQSADDVLKIWLERNVGQDILLVTSDRQVRDYGLNLNVVSISSQDFYKVFKSVMHQEEIIEQKFMQTVHKTKVDEEKVDFDLDALMEQASRNLVADNFKNEYPEPVRIRDNVKVGKADRKIMKKIDKI